MKIYILGFFGSGVLDTRLIGRVLGKGDCCLLGGDEDSPLLWVGGLSELRAARGRGEGEERLVCGGDRVSRPERLGEVPFLCLEGNDGECLFPTGEPLSFGGGECDTLCFDGGGDCDTRRFGGGWGSGEEVLLFGGGEGEYLL